VAYDLTAIFNGETGFSGEVADRRLTIPADQTIPADDIFRIKRLTREFKAAIAQAQTIDSIELAEFEQLNPELFTTHEILGDYHFAQSDTASARRYWKTALTKMIPKQSERERIEKKISGLY
jgi:predicted negative regulator of RcsB-dependent stress response